MQNEVGNKYDSKKSFIGMTVDQVRSKLKNVRENINKLLNTFEKIKIDQF